MQRFLLMARLGILNIKHNWRHSLSTLLTIALGFASVALFDGFLAHMGEFIYDSHIHRGMLGHVVIEKQEGPAENGAGDEWKTTLNEGEQATIEDWLKQDSRVKARLRVLVGNGVINAGNSSPVFITAGYDVAEGKILRGSSWEWNTVSGRPLQHEDSEAILLGTGIARQLGCQFDSAGAENSDGTYRPIERAMNCKDQLAQLTVTTEGAQVNAISLQPVGVLDLLLREANDRFVSMPLAVAQRLFDTNSITRMSILLNDDRDQAKFIASIQERAVTAGISLKVIPWIEHASAAAAKGGMEILRMFRGLFMSVVIFIAAMLVANAMMKTINERVREIGTLRSVGFRRLDIVWMFVVEGASLAVIASLVGLLLSGLVAAILGYIQLSFRAGILSKAIPVLAPVHAVTAIEALVLLVLICGGTTWLVCRKIVLQPVADCLRQTE